MKDKIINLIEAIIIKKLIYQNVWNKYKYKKLLSKRNKKLTNKISKINNKSNTIKVNKIVVQKT